MYFRAGFSVSVIIALVLAIVQMGCTGVQSGLPSAVLLNDSTPPCWFDICPGTTQKEQALTLLERMPYVDASSIVDRPSNTTGSYISWRFIPEVQDYGRLYYHDDTVTYVSIDPRPKDTLTLADVVSKYGDPGKVWAFSDCDDSRWLYVALIYPIHGLYVLYFDSSWAYDKLPDLQPEYPVSEVIYYDRALFEDLMMRFEGANWLGYGYEMADILRNLQPWRGFGEIDVIMKCVR